MYMNSAAHPSNHGWRPSILPPNPLVHPSITRIRNPLAPRYSLRDRRLRMSSRMPSLFRRPFKMEESRSLYDNISDYEELNYFNFPTLHPVPTTRAYTRVPTTQSRSESDLATTGFDLATIEDTFNTDLNIPTGSFNSSLSDSVVTNFPGQRQNPWFPARPPTPPLSGLPQLVNMRDVHNATPPLSMSGSTSGLPFPLSSGTEQMGPVMSTPPTSASIDFGVASFTSGTEGDAQRAPNNLNWALQRWCDENTAASSQGIVNEPNTPASMPSLPSPVPRPQTTEGVPFGSSPVSFTVAPERVTPRLNESMFPVYTSSFMKTQMNRTQPLGPTSVPSAMSASTSKRSHEEGSSYTESGSDEDFEPAQPAGRQKRLRMLSKDEQLVQGREDGLSYKEIKAKYKFSEAESTLRGRYRTLTKQKEDRVRKPTWTKHDISLLTECVESICRGRDPCEVKISWKQVATYILENGGSYHFGNATCRKKWDELTEFEG